jgi:F420-non-reducing hydrogenase small subunit
MPKKNLAIYAASGCGGCSQSLLLSPSLKKMLNSAELLFWATEEGDLTVDDIDKYGDRDIDILMYVGPVHGQEAVAVAKLLRCKARRVVAYGACAHLGGLCGLANVAPGAQLRGRAEANGEFVQPLPAVIDVDYIIAGCPPPQTMIERMIEELFLSDQAPDQGTVFANEKAVCAECDRRHIHNPLTEIKRYHASPPDPEICLIDQGYICLGPVTRGGCGAVCLKSNRPCTGCSGSVAGVRDQGAAILHALASLVSFSGEGKEAKGRKVLDSVLDIVGTAYKYSAASSVLKGRVNDGE